jgi:hypothetical protein
MVLQTSGDAFHLQKHVGITLNIPSQCLCCLSRSSLSLVDHADAVYVAAAGGTARQATRAHMDHNKLYGKHAEPQA